MLGARRNDRCVCRVECANVIGSKEAAAKLKISDRRVRVLCAQNRIKGAEKVGKSWVMPSNPVILPVVKRKRS